MIRINVFDLIASSASRREVADRLSISGLSAFYRWPPATATRSRRTDLIHQYNGSAGAYWPKLNSSDGLHSYYFDHRP